ncbi:MAG: DUF2339 domain-containing protein [Myxococcales bacterium FL481]|nr:MAG: DUF2339 domain-containing protein [Myxococcales bacterium FL481]
MPPWLLRFARLRLAWLLLLVVGLYSPIFTATPTLDDRVGLQALSQSTVAPLKHAPWDLYRICEPFDQATRSLETWGAIPWYFDPDANLVHFRPVSSLLLAFDYWLAPGQAWWSALHGLGWYAVLIAGLRRLYRRWFDERWAAGLAVALFALDDTHTFTVGWAANRHLLLCACAAVWGWLAHLRWREEGWALGRWWSVLLFSLGFLSGEAMVGLFSYIVVDALARAPGPLAARLWPLRDALVVVLVWAALYLGLGYGTHGSGVYDHPLEEPVAFLMAVIRWVPIHWLAQFTPIPSDPAAAVMIEPDLAPVLILTTLPPALALAWWGWKTLADTPRARPLMLAVVANLMVMAAGMPGDRGLLATGIGGSALTVMLVQALTRTRWQRGVGTVVLVVHLFLPVLGVPARAHLFTTIGPAWDRVAQHMESVDPNKPLVMLTTPGMLGSVYFMFARHQTGHAVPPRIEQIGSTHAEVRLRRTASQELELQTSGHFTSTFDDLPCREPSLPFVAGAVHKLAVGRVTVISIGADGLPTALRLELNRPVDELQFAKWTDRGFEPLPLPPVGSEIELPATSLVPPGV